MGTNRLKWPSTLNLVGIKNSPAKFFSQSLSQQAKRAMLLALVPIVILTLWYAQQVAQHQQETNHIYHKNQSLVLSFNTLKGDISALEKAHLNNQLLNNAQLQKSIEEKWQVTNKRIEFLKKSHVSEQIVAKWQQLQNLAPKTHVLNVDYAKLQQQLLKLEQPLHKAIEDSLSQQAIAFSTLNQYFLAGLFLFIPLLIVISLIVIRKVTNQLNALERVILQLGEGNFAKPITLHGSEEFVALGKELDWLREELHLSHKQKDTFLRHVSHELKTPLASLTEGNSLLQSDSFGTVTKAQKRIINIMDGALSRLATLIDDLLNYSAANHPLSQQLYSFDQIKLELIKHFEQQINDSRLRIHWNHEDSAPLLPYLPIKLILTQLLGNALQYAHSHIEIHSQIEQEQVQLSVIDDGPGIDLSEQHKLMQPFYRGKHSEQHNGSGLGLAIVAECVKQLHGTVKWQHAQTGSHICIQFPIQRELSNA